MRFFYLYTKFREEKLGIAERALPKMLEREQVENFYLWLCEKGYIRPKPRPFCRKFKKKATLGELTGEERKVMIDHPSTWKEKCTCGIKFNEVFGISDGKCNYCNREVG